MTQAFSRRKFDNTDEPFLVTGSGTTVIFTGEGLLMGVTIWNAVDGAYIHFTDADGNNVTGTNGQVALPTSTNKGDASAQGAFNVPRLEIRNGLKIVVTNGTGLVLSVWGSSVD